MTAPCQTCGASASAPRRVMLHGVQVASDHRCEACLWAKIAEQRRVFEESVAARVSYAAASRIMLARIAGTAVAS